MSLRKHALTGAVWTTIARLGERASVFLIMLVLLRLLDVHEFGTASTAVMMITVLWPVARFGSYNYIIQHENPDEGVLTGALLATLVFAVGATVALALAAIPLAGAFDDPKLGPVLIALSPVFILKSLGTVPEALLTKQFGFKALTIRQLTSVIVGGLAAIASAAIGWGVYALVIQQLVMALISTLATYWAVNWKWDILSGLSHVRSVWSMGSKFTMAQLLTSVNLSGYGLIIGLFLSTKDAGLFRLGFSAVDLATQIAIMPFVTVAVPIFARLRDDRTRLRAGYLKLLQATSLGTFVIFAWMAIMGPEIGRVMYGERFEEAARLIPIFCLAVFAGTTNRLITALLSATGRAGELAKLAVVQAGCALLLACISAPFGLTFAAAGHVLRSMLTTPLSYRKLNQAAGVTLNMSAQKLKWPLFASVAAILPLIALKQYDGFNVLALYYRLPVSAVVVGVFYVAFISLFKPILFVEMLEIISEKLAKRVLGFNYIGSLLRRGRGDA